MSEQEAARAEQAEQLDALIEQAISKSQEINDTVLLSLTEECPDADPLRFFASAITSATERVYWEDPAGEFTMASAGVLAGRIVSKLRRFQRVDEVIESTLETAFIDPPLGESNPGPLMYAGFAFDPDRRADLRTWLGFGSGYIVVPQVTVLRRGEKKYLTVNIMLTPKRTLKQAKEQIKDLRDRSYRSFEREIKKLNTLITSDIDEAIAADRDRFRQSVEQTLSAIGESPFESVALVRKCEIDSNFGYDVVNTLDYLRNTFPDSVTFALSRRDGAFFGAAPVKLVSKQGKNITTACVSGAAVTIADEQGETSQNGEQLLQDQRELQEHEIAVKAAREALEPMCAGVSAADSPEVLSSGSLNHLCTAFSGEAGDDTTLIKLVEQLHPAASVGGHPKTEALAFLREHEEINRGWYGSPFGWIDGHGDGEFIIAAPAALFRGRRAHIYATCGIVPGADVAHEVEESEALLRPMIDALVAVSGVKEPEPEPEAEDEEDVDAESEVNGGEVDGDDESETTA
jgi:menaquinone-specific isochorismate synthase